MSYSPLNTLPPAQPKPLLSIIMPCYNEEHTIRAIIEQVQTVNLEKEIIVVDDYSRDGTPEILRALREMMPNLRTFRHERNRGKGDAIRTGLSHARGEIVIIQDADLEYDPNDYYELVRPIVAGKVDVVFWIALSWPTHGHVLLECNRQ